MSRKLILVSYRDVEANKHYHMNILPSQPISKVESSACSGTSSLEDPLQKADQL